MSISIPDPEGVIPSARRHISDGASTLSQVAREDLCLGYIPSVPDGIVLRLAPPAAHAATATLCF